MIRTGLSYALSPPSALGLVSSSLPPIAENNCMVVAMDGARRGWGLQAECYYHVLLLCVRKSKMKNHILLICLTAHAAVDPLL